MNRFCYRVIFNKNLERLVVVSEVTKAQAKSNVLGGSLNKPTGLLGCLKTKLLPLTAACLLGFGGSASAHILPDSQAPTSQRPVIAAAKNNRQQTVALVQIQTPVQGVSHNKYTQFDVSGQGIILNNARIGVSTQLAGTVAANPFLKQGEAHTIVNEVRSSKASQLAGSIEVAGQKANLVIANPSGINVAGAGFMNVHEATLSTGKITNHQGKVSHNIHQGVININTPKGTSTTNQTSVNTNAIGLGGNNKNADLVNLYSKTANINAQVQAQYAITAVAGANQISDTGQITPITNNKTTTTNNIKPTTAIDVKALGGMSAGSITLIGTDKGLGVNQAGNLSARQAIIITADGKITHTGKSNVQQQGAISLKSNTAIELTGKADTATATTNNKSTVQAGNNLSVSAPTISVNNATLGSTGNITLHAKQKLNTNNTTLNATQNIEAIVLNPAQNNASGAAVFTNTTFVSKGATTTANLQGDLTHSQSSINAAGNVSSYAKAQQTLRNTNITSQNSTQIQANKNLAIDNSKVNSAKHTSIYTQGNQTTTNSAIAAKGIVSDVVKGNHAITGTSTYQAGAVLLDSTDLTLNGKLVAKTSKTRLLDLSNNQNNQTGSLNGALSIQADNEITLNNTNHHFNSSGDVSIVSKVGKLSLLNTHNATNKNQTPYILNTHQGNLTLQGSAVHLQGVDLKAKNNLTVYATAGSVVMDGIERRFSNKNQSGSDQKRALEARLAKVKADEAAFKQSQAWRDYEKEKSKLESQDFKYEIYHSLPHGVPEDIRVGIASQKWQATLQSFDEKHKNLTAKSEEFTHTKSRIESQLGILNGNSSGLTHTPTTLTTQTGDIGVYAKQGISAEGVQISSLSGNVTLETQGALPGNYTLSAAREGHKNNYKASIYLSDLRDEYHQGRSADNEYKMTYVALPTIINAKQNINIQSSSANKNSRVLLQGAQLAADGTVAIKANDGIVLDGMLEQYYYKYHHVNVRRNVVGRKKVTTTDIEDQKLHLLPTQISANGIDLQNTNKQTGIDLYGTYLNANVGNISINSAGSIHMFAVQNTNHYSKTENTKKNWSFISLGKSNQSDIQSKNFALPASLTAQFINSRSEADTLLEGTRFEYLQGAHISAGGKIKLIAALSELQTATQREDNWVVWQRQQGEGQHAQTAQLPSFTGTTAPVFEAQGGLVVQIPDSEKNKQRKQLTEQILDLARQPEYSYLNELINRDDIDWQQIILTDKDWDYKQQGLTPAGAAIVAIAVAYATAGAGSELALTISAKTGSAALGAAGKAAFISLSQKASISAINNQGNLKAVFKELGGDDSVKSLVTSAVTAGLLEKLGGTNWVQKLGKGTQTTLDERLFKGIIDSTASAIVQTGIQGGSLSDNLESALRSGLATALQGEAASHIKGLEDVNWILHKIAHAAAGCVAAELQKDCESGAIGAVVGEVVAMIMPTPDINLSAYGFKITQEKNRNIAKLITGVVAAYAGYNVDTATSSADTAISKNRQLHEHEINIIKQAAKGLAKTQKISESEAYTLLYSWIYAQLDTKANQILAGRLTVLRESNHSILWDPNFHPQEDYEKLIVNLQAADVIYQELVKKHGDKILKDTTGKIIKTSDGQSVLMFKSTAEQQDKYNLFGAPTTHSGGIIGGTTSFLYSNSPALNSASIKQMDSYFNNKIDVYQKYDLVTSGQVYPVYPEDWLAAGKVVVGTGKLTANILKGFLGKSGSVKSTASNSPNGIGTVYNSIKSTQELIPGTSIPKSFELKTSSDTFWIHPNATKHMAEYITRNGVNPNTQDIRSQQLLASFHAAINKASKQGIRYGEKMHIDNWELIFSKGKPTDKFPVIKHAIYK